jgi:hypothetical protein
MEEDEARLPMLHEPDVDQITYTYQSCCQCQVSITFPTSEIREVCSVTETTLDNHRHDRVTHNSVLILN